MRTILMSAALITTLTLASWSEARPSLSTLPVEPFRVGRIYIHNNYDGPIRINLFHPANPGVVDQFYDFAAGEKAYLSDIFIGEDWGIQVDYLNGSRSKICRVGTVAPWRGSFSGLATNIK